jgi:hypothetical protein
MPAQMVKAEWALLELCYGSAGTVSFERQAARVLVVRYSHVAAVQASWLPRPYVELQNNAITSNVLAEVRLGLSSYALGGRAGRNGACLQNCVHTRSGAEIECLFSWVTAVPTKCLLLTDVWQACWQAAGVVVCRFGYVAAVCGQLSATQSRLFWWGCLADERMP